MRIAQACVCCLHMISVLLLLDRIGLFSYISSIFNASTITSLATFIDAVCAVWCDIYVAFNDTNVLIQPLDFFTLLACTVLLAFRSDAFYDIYSHGVLSDMQDESNVGLLQRVWRRIMKAGVDYMDESAFWWLVFHAILWLRYLAHDREAYECVINILFSIVLVIYIVLIL